jgi:hypothetical protein
VPAKDPPSRWQSNAAAESHPKRQSSASGKTPKKLRFAIQFGRIEIHHRRNVTPEEFSRFKSRRHPKQPANLGKSQQPFAVSVNRQTLNGASFAGALFTDAAGHGQTGYVNPEGGQHVAAPRNDFSDATGIPHSDKFFSKLGRAEASEPKGGTRKSRSKRRIS